MTLSNQVAFDVVERGTLDSNVRPVLARLVVGSATQLAIMLQVCAIKTARIGVETVVVEGATVGKDLKIEVAKIVEEGHQADITLKAGKGVRVETDTDLIVKEIDLIVREIKAGKGLALFLMRPQRWQIELITH